MEVLEDEVDEEDARQRATPQGSLEQGPQLGEGAAGQEAGEEGEPAPSPAAVAKGWG